MLASCKKETKNSPNTAPPSAFYNAVDLSEYPDVLRNDIDTFYYFDGEQGDALQILKDNGVNTIRLRLWVHPDSIQSSYNEVVPFAHELQLKGFKIWLTLHYSDWWADPSQQVKPKAWKNVSFNALQDSVYHYTKKVVKAINPAIVQIGNELNNGFLHPEGHINNMHSFLQLLTSGINACRENSPQTQIMLHFAGTNDAEWFYNQVDTLDYDYIGVSYYPWWHGKDLTQLELDLQKLNTFNKPIIIAETAYPFTLSWNDWTNNIIGGNDQLILPDYPATPAGQKNFINAVKSTLSNNPNGKGIAYWGAIYIAYKGSQATNGSPWENMALFDFTNRAQPALEIFND